MIKFLLRTFYYNNETYYTDSPSEEVTKSIEALLTERKGLFTSPNLTGAFENYPATFTLRPKWSLAFIQNFERRPAYLKGIIHDTENGKTKIEVAVRPNSVLGVLFILFLAFGLYNLFRYFGSTKDLNTLLLGLFIIIIAIAALIAIARAMTYSLRNSFETYMQQYGIALTNNRR